MRKRVLVVLSIFMLCLLLWEFKSAYALFETNGSGDAVVDIAKWKIKVNNTDVTKLSVSSNYFDLGAIKWKNNVHVKDGKAAPGSVGSFDILIDPTNTDVSFCYEISFDFSNIDNSEFILSSISEINGGFLVRTGKYTYTGIVPLSTIKQNRVYDIKVSFSWNNNENNNDNDYNIGSKASSKIIIPVSFQILQYQSTDKIVEYVEEGSDNDASLG